MSDPIQHECGVALVRLRKPISYYRDRYGDAAWGLRRLYLLMEKQHNRGQDGAGIAVVKFDMPPGERFMIRTRSAKRNALERIFDTVTGDLNRLHRGKLEHADDLTLKHTAEYLGELLLGHLRYGTYAGNAQGNCHPYTRKNNVASRSLAVAGNFNLTNSDEVFAHLVNEGLHLVGDSDTQIVLERLGFELDREHERLRTQLKKDGLRGIELARGVAERLDYQRVLELASKNWDGGYVFATLVGHGDAFICRDPSGIRPCFVHETDDVVAIASERGALSSVFNVDPSAVRPLTPGSMLIIRKNGEIAEKAFAGQREIRQCTFERIYFSRGNDPDIYKERKALGRQLAPRVLSLIDYDIDQTVFSFVPNTAETAYLGLLEELEYITQRCELEDLWIRISDGTVTREDVEAAMARRVRAEKIAHKDQRLRTFITHDAARRDLVSHIYDVTRSVVRPTDHLVVLDDSIVRGTTLRESIITMLSRVNPRTIIVASSAPPIMYPDCYGIDMSQLGRFIAFEAAVTLLRERGDADLLDEVERRCVAQDDAPGEKLVNHVGMIYDQFSLDELSAKIAELIRPSNIPWKGDIKVVYQSVDGLHRAMPSHTGDWFFTGRYPTPGGYRVLNRSFLKWRSADDARAY
jgi:amidophosphoribosyltransferase